MCKMFVHETKVKKKSYVKFVISYVMINRLEKPTAAMLSLTPYNHN